jgi:hypothetical protein
LAVVRGGLEPLRLVCFVLRPPRVRARETPRNDRFGRP